jgi:HEAT repeat protein
VAFFISYKREDREFVETMVDQLHEAGVPCWVDHKLQAGELWKEVIDAQIRDAEGIILVVSPKALKSQWVTYEWSFAMGVGKTREMFIPILIEPVDLKEWHNKLLDIHYLDFTEHHNWSALVSRLKEIRKKKPSESVLKAEAALNDVNKDTVRSAVETLQNSRDPLAIEVMARNVEHPTPWVAASVAIALAERTQYTDERVLPGLEIALTSPVEGHIIKSAIDALGQIGSDKAVTVLFTRVSKMSSQRRDYIENIIGALGNAKSDLAVECLIWIYQQKTLANSVEVLGAIGKTRNPSAIPFLTNEIDHHINETFGLHHNQLRRLCFLALANMGELGLRTLAQYLTSHPYGAWIIESAASALEGSSDPQSLDILQNSLSVISPNATREVHRVMHTLQARFQKPVGQ